MKKETFKKIRKSGKLSQGRFGSILGIKQNTVSDYEKGKKPIPKPKGNIGGAAGIRIPLGGRFALDLEGQYRQGFSAGGMITYSFK